MESVHKERKSAEKTKEARHPLDRKFSSIEEASAAKIEYIKSTKSESFWEKLKKFTEKQLR